MPSIAKNWLNKCLHSKKRRMEHLGLGLLYKKERLYYFFRLDRCGYSFKTSEVELIICNRPARMGYFRLTYFAKNKVKSSENIDVTYYLEGKNLYLKMRIEDFRRIAHGCDLWLNPIDGQSHDLPSGLSLRSQYYHLISSKLPKGKTEINIHFKANELFSCTYYIPLYLLHFKEALTKQKKKKAAYQKSLILQRKNSQSSVKK